MGLGPQWGLWEPRRRGDRIGWPREGQASKCGWRTCWKGLPGTASVSKNPDTEPAATRGRGAAAGTGAARPWHLRHSPSEAARAAGRPVADCPGETRPQRRRSLRLTYSFALKKWHLPTSGTLGLRMGHSDVCTPDPNEPHEGCGCQGRAVWAELGASTRACGASPLEARAPGSWGALHWPGTCQTFSGSWESGM